ncbi:hypothetical protein D9M68_866750 [compost metagenome]
MPGDVDEIAGAGSRAIGNEYGPAVAIVARDYSAYLHQAVSKFCKGAVACGGMDSVSDGGYAPLTPGVMGR